MEFCPNNYPFFGKNEIDPFFWPIFAEFFIPPGNMFIRTFFLRNNSIFLKKSKNAAQKWSFAQKVPRFFAYFYK
jgi:hypothetical protein